MQTMEYTGQLVITRCWCGIRVGIPDDLYRWAQADKRHAVHCPLGHEFIFADNETDRARRRAEQAEAREASLRVSVQAARDQARAAERSARAYKGHITRMKNRIANGVCPVPGCHRHFDQVQAHIETVHPEWAAQHVEALGR